MGVMKRGNIAPRVRIEPTSLELWASALPLHHIGSLMSPLFPRLPVYVAPCLRVYTHTHIYIYIYIYIE